MSLAWRRRHEAEKYDRVYTAYPNYGNRPARIAMVGEWVRSHPEARSFLDVGCGRGEVLDVVGASGLRTVKGCEVAECLGHREDVDLIEGAHHLPYGCASYDLVACCDVMEHIIEADVDDVLYELGRVSVGPVLLCISHIPDRNDKYGNERLHITVKPREWWKRKIHDNMEVTSLRRLYEDRTNDSGTWWEVLCA